MTDMVERVAQPLGGDDLVMRLMYELHAHVPEDQRPLSMSDLSDEQAARAQKAVHAVLTEWESAKAALAADTIEQLVGALERAIVLLEAQMISRGCDRSFIDDYLKGFRDVLSKNGGDA